MKVLILAGGFGTRLSEETTIKPKPIIEIGGKPILWHIMKHYSYYGFNDFVILLGYKGYLIKEYFFNYYMHQSDLTIDLSNNEINIHNNQSEPWKVTLIDTGLNTLTGGRIKLAKKYINNEPFMLTYGDGVSDIDIKKLLTFHRKKGKLLTMSSIQPEGRFGSLDIDSNNIVNSFIEKPKGDGGWINGGFFVCEPEVLEYIDNSQTTFEKEPLEKIAKEQQLVSYQHYGFWQCMDNQRDRKFLEEKWSKNEALWKVW